jgi:hypothetical protein
LCTPPPSSRATDREPRAVNVSQVPLAVQSPPQWILPQ